MIQDLGQLYEAFKGHPEDQSIDASALYFFLNQQRLLVSEPEFCFYLYKNFKETPQITKQQYERVFREFKSELPKTLEEIRILFNSIDYQNKGIITLEDFMHLFQLSDTYKSNPKLVYENAERTFRGICEAFRVPHLTLELVYYLVKDLQSGSV